MFYCFLITHLVLLGNIIFLQLIINIILVLILIISEIHTNYKK